MTDQTVTWESFSWRLGAESYSFEIQDKGLIGRLKVSDGRTFALPIVVWEAMFDAVKTNRSARSKTDAGLPARAGATWTEAECDQLIAKFRSGRSIAHLAKEHGRTVWAIEDQLAKLGLWDRIERRPRS